MSMLFRLRIGDNKSSFQSDLIQRCRLDHNLSHRCCLDHNPLHMYFLKMIVPFQKNLLRQHHRLQGQPT